MCFVSTSCKLLPGRTHSHELCFPLYAVGRATGKTPAANTVVMVGPLLKRTGRPGLRVPNTPQTSSPVSARISRSVKSCTDHPN